MGEVDRVGDGEIRWGTRRQTVLLDWTYFWAGVLLLIIIFSNLGV